MLFFLWKENRRNSTVLDSFGESLEGASIQVFNPRFEAEINGSGKYAIDYAAGEVYIKFTHDNYLKREEIFISQKYYYKNLIVTFR